MKCWICGDEGNTGEHMIKRSDLASVFGKPTQNAPFYLHDTKRRNRNLGSLDNRRLKSPSRICARCNNDRTQPYDRAWEQLSSALRTRNLPIGPRAIVRANRIFRYNTRKQMLDVHLFFVKLFGCHIVTGDIPIDISSFATAILERRHHPCVYLKFGLVPRVGDKPIAGMSDIEAALTPDGSCAFATWFYEVDNLAVNVMFAVDGEDRQGMVDAWHPQFGTNKLTISGFQ